MICRITLQKQLELLLTFCIYYPLSHYYTDMMYYNMRRIFTAMKFYAVQEWFYVFFADLHYEDVVVI